ncbi:MAG TPA: PEP/pyruvate-binding domain-containing protein [Anaerolineales bacterium]|nr:PEP/pyruvate-binding domain-containing protein [Anaerolineales bacterium]
MTKNRFDTGNVVLVAPLLHFRQSDLAIAGGKGANLGELSQAGFNVPPGYVITTAAYDLLLQQNDTQTRLKEMVDSLDANDQDTVAKLGQQIQNLLREIPIPKQIIDEILKAYHQLDGGAVAVRSSATAEDLPEAAFAGQQETFLNVVGEQALLEAVHACWASLWSERAILYRARQNVDQNAVKLAVVVQKMVPADVAGVMFTANPVSGGRDELIIDANPGLGEAVVSGTVTPDHFIIDKRTRRVKEQQLGKREIIVRSKAGGGIEQFTSGQEITDPALPPQAMRRLVKLGIDIEHHYGSPQDIEWAWINDETPTGRFFVLQARPMTALPEPLDVSGPMRLVVPMLIEMWPMRPYPLDMTTFTAAVERAIGSFLVTMIGKSAPDPDEMFVEEDGVVLQFKPPKVHPSPGMLFMPWLAIWRTRHYDPVHWEADPLLAEFIATARTLEKHDLQSLTWEENIEILQQSLALIPRAMELRERYFPQVLLGLAGLWLLLALAGRRDRFGALVSGVQTKTTETNQVLEDLATEIRADPALQDLLRQTEARQLRARLETSKAGRDFMKRFEAFLGQYGHRESSLTISQPAWKDQPDHVLAILKVLAETQPQQRDSHNAWQQTRDELLASSILGNRLLRGLFLKTLTNARAFFQIREDTHFYVTLVQPTIRHVALELGSRLVQAGALDEVEDVFHLRLDELEMFGRQLQAPEEAIVEIRELVARRKARRESLANKSLVDPRLLSLMSQTQAGKDVLVSGTSGSPGVVRGPAKIVNDISEFGKLRAGDVLVAPVTNPAWTPLFQRAAAVVVDAGGAASHAAIVAREYGIPAVMGTINGTKELKDGQWIQVDGTRGLVLKAEEQEGVSHAM